MANLTEPPTLEMGILRVYNGLQKWSSSIILYLTDPLQANLALTQQIAFCGTLRAMEKSHHSLTQCHNCQHFGHTTARCSAQQNCSRCATNHLTTACFCTETPACSDHRTCPLTKCVLCRDSHRATDKTYPFRLKAVQ
jgi:hypothetical protein